MKIIRENLKTGEKVTLHENANMSQFQSIVTRGQKYAKSEKHISFHDARDFEVKTKTGKHYRFVGV